MFPSRVLGFDSIIELVAGSILSWRLLVEQRGGSNEVGSHAECRASWITGFSLFGLALYIVTDSAIAFFAQSRAARVGIAKGTVYLHFPSKEDLVVAIFESDMQQLLQYMDLTMDSTLTARGKIEAIFDLMHVGIMSKRVQLLFSVSNSAGLKHLLVEKKGCLREIWDQLSERLNSLFEEGKAAGDFDYTLPTMVMLSAFYSLLSPKSYDRLMTEGHMSGEEVAKNLKRIYFKGISAN